MQHSPGGSGAHLFIIQHGVRSRTEPGDQITPQVGFPDAAIPREQCNAAFWDPVWDQPFDVLLLDLAHFFQIGRIIGIVFHGIPETKCQGLFSTPYISLHEKSHCRFLHNGYKVMFYSLLITGKLMPKLEFVA